MYKITEKEYEQIIEKVQTLEKENAYLKGLLKGQEKAFILCGVSINNVALPIGTEVLFEGEQRFITKYDEYNKTLAYRLNGTESTELYVREDFDEILE